jgi:hypothetical protein
LLCDHVLELSEGSTKDALIAFPCGPAVKRTEQMISPAVDIERDRCRLDWAVACRGRQFGILSMESPVCPDLLEKILVRFNSYTVHLVEPPKVIHPVFGELLEAEDGASRFLLGDS